MGDCSVTVSVSLLIRLMEFAREEAKSDVDLHDVAENMVRLGRPLDMNDYESIMGSNPNMARLLYDVKMRLTK